MPWNIVIIPSERPTPQVVAPATVRRRARESGNPNAGRQDIAGVTVPRIRVDQTGLRYEQRRSQGRVEFRFETGQLQIQYWHHIYLSRTLSPCERRIWTSHELDHVRDNERLVGVFSDRIQGDPYMQSVFVQRQWLPRNSFNLIQAGIEETCVRIFREITAQAVRRRDTPSEYQRIRDQIRTTCRGRRTSLRHRSRAQQRR